MLMTFFMESMSGCAVWQNRMHRFSMYQWKGKAWFLSWQVCGIVINPFNTQIKELTISSILEEYDLI